MDSRSNILSCALRLFTARGYDAVGVQEIAEGAGITKPTLYHFFGSKQGLLEALLEEGFQALRAAVEPACQYQRDLPLTLTRVASAFFSFADRERLFYRLQLSLWFAPPDSEPFKVVSRLNEELFELIEDIFKRAALDHGNMKGRHRPYAATFIGMINNYIALALNEYTKLSDKLVHQAVHQFMHGIFS